MELIERIEADFKEALKARRQTEVSTLRLARSAFKVKEKEDQGELNDEEALRILKRQAKQRRESIEQYTQAGRDDLVAKEREELEIIEAYLPAQADEATIRKVVSEVIEEQGAKSPKEMGLVMKESLARLGAGADGKKVNQIARELLQGG